MLVGSLKKGQGGMVDQKADSLLGPWHACDVDAVSF